MKHAKGRETESSAVYNTGVRWGTTSETNGATSEKGVTSQMKSLQHTTQSESEGAALSLSSNFETLHDLHVS